MREDEADHRTRLRFVRNCKNDTNSKWTSCLKFRHISQIYIYICLLLLILIPHLCADDNESPFLTEPNAKPYFVKEFEPGPLLQCTLKESYRNRGHYELAWIKVVDGLPITVSQNSELFEKLYYNLEENIKNGEYNLRMKTVALAQDNGNFFCAVIDLEHGHRHYHSKPAKIVVVVRPEEPRIIEQPSEAVRENSLVTMQCSSRGGNPPPRFAWVFDNNTEVPASWSQSHQSDKDTSISTLRWQVRSEDNGAFLVCQIWNEAMHSAEILSTESRKINVLYPPRVTVGPQSELNIEDGEMVELNCQADGNPKPEHFEWKHIGTGTSSSHSKWRFTANPQLSGEYRCISSNDIDAGVAKLHVNVFYAPRMKIRQLAGVAGPTNVAADVTSTRIEPAEGEELVLECEVDAMPAVDQISWLSPSGEFLHNGSRLVIPQVQRMHTGNFTCLTMNTLSGLYSPSLTSSQRGAATLTQIRTREVSVQVDVRRKPGAATISVTKNVVVTGDRVVLTCRASDIGNPPALYRWETPHGFNAKSSLESQELIIESVKLEDNGRYKCVPYNDIGQGKEATTKILVIEPARILHSLPPKKTFSAGDTDSSIHCEAQGYPVPRFVWLKDGIVIADSDTSSRPRQHWIAKEQEHNQNGCAADSEEPCLRTVVGTLAFFDTVQWLDKGNYTCRACNNVANTPAICVSSTITITITHEPTILNERLDGEAALAAADIGSPAQIICLVSAHPTPSISWTRNGHEIANEDEPRYMIRSSRLYDRQDEYESILRLSNVGPADYGAYGCVASNSAGPTKAALEIRLQPKSRPQEPRNPRLLKAGVTWLQVGWRESFDGGDTQIFEIEFHVIDPHGNAVADSTVTLFYSAHNATLATIYETPGQSANEDVSAEIIRRRRSPVSDLFPVTTTFYVHNMTRLRPLNAFSWRVRARNSLGASEWTPSLVVGTADTVDNESIIAPESVQYFFDDQKLIVQPFKSTVTSILANKSSNHGKAKVGKEATKKAPAGLCVLVYVASGESPLRSVDCFPHQTDWGSPIVIENLRPAERFRVRFCRRDDLTICSAHADFSVDPAAMATLAPSWALLAAVGAGVVACALSCFTLLFCCRRLLFPGEFHGSSSVTTTVSTVSSQKKPLNGKKQLKLNGKVSINKYDVSAPMAPENKSNPVHSSQNDSGVFTLGSSTNAIIQTANGFHLNNSSNSENWRQLSDSNNLSADHLPYDFSNDPYLQEFHNLHGIVAMENGLASDELREPRSRSQQSNILNSVQSIATSMLLRQSQTQAQARRSASLSSSAALHVNHHYSQMAHSDQASQDDNCDGIDGADVGAIVVGSDGASSGNAGSAHNNETLLVTTPPLPSSFDDPTSVERRGASDSGASSATASINGNGCRVMREIIV